MSTGVSAGAAPGAAPGSVFLAERFGLVAPIASGCRGLSYLLLAVYALPLPTRGAWLSRRRDPAPATAAPSLPSHR